MEGLRGSIGRIQIESWIMRDGVSSNFKKKTDPGIKRNEKEKTKKKGRETNKVR